MFAVSAWSTGGFAEMVVSVHATEAEARAARDMKAAQFPRWTFRITEAHRA